MAKKKIFSKPFDEGTKIKLDIFRNYLKAWLPTFISSTKEIYWDTIYIYDFFAGEGKDSIGTLGSPLIILDVLNEFDFYVNRTPVKIKVFLNEKGTKEYNKLCTNVNAFNYNSKVDVQLINEPFKDYFNSIYLELQETSKYPKLFFLDQYGVKEIAENIFKQLISFKRTDFIFFISSSFVKRFNEKDEFKTYLSIKKDAFYEKRPFQSHRVVFEYYKQLIDTDYMLAPFSIKKKANIYGLIFGANNPFGLEKFLRVCWKINTHTGDSNYNIDEEGAAVKQLELFGNNSIKKLARFENELEQKIRNKELETLYLCYIFTLDYGCLPKHANKILKKLIEKNVIQGELTLKNAKIHSIKTNGTDQKIILKK